MTFAVRFSDLSVGGQRGGVLSRTDQASFSPAREQPAGGYTGAQENSVLPPEDLGDY